MMVEDILSLFFYDLTRLQQAKSKLKIDSHIKDVFSRVFVVRNNQFSRFKIIMTIKDNPSLNIQQIAAKLGYEYTAIKRSLTILEENHLINRIGNGYGDTFTLANLMINNMENLYLWIELQKKKYFREKKYID